MNDCSFILLLRNHSCLGLSWLPLVAASGCLVQDLVLSWWLGVPKLQAVGLGRVPSRRLCSGAGSSRPPSLGALGPITPRESHSAASAPAPLSKFCFVLLSRNIYYVSETLSSQLKT